MLEHRLLVHFSKFAEFKGCRCWKEISKTLGETFCCKLEKNILGILKALEKTI